MCGEQDRAVFVQQTEQQRNMYCTAGFFHATGKCVTNSGEIVAVQQAGDAAVFSFDAIDVVCSDAGETRWQPSAQPGNRFIFRVRDKAAYPNAMTTAMKTLLTTLP